MTIYNLPKSHPRYQSLYYRDLLTLGVKKGIVSPQGLTAHGRGEAFDYLLLEKTHLFARQAIKAAASLLLLSRYPVISVNGNSAFLSGKEFVKLSKLLNAPLEINLFHYSENRVKKIAHFLSQLGATKILLPDKIRFPIVESNRGMINPQGQAIADTVFVPLEDGDRTEKLVSLGKKVITVDLNPLSRTAQKATVTIVDNIVRTIPLLVETTRLYKSKSQRQLCKIYESYNNQLTLAHALATINNNLTKLSEKLTL